METNQSTQLEYYEIPICSNYKLDARKKYKTDIDTQIYSGRKIFTNEKVVFKLKNKKYRDSIYIYKEFKVYAGLRGIKRIPKCSGVCSQGIYNILIIEQLGPSLKELLQEVGGKFTLATTLKVCMQVLDIIEKIHEKGFVLRYIKPGNMVIGLEENKDYIYLIDFEIAERYIQYGKHIPYEENIEVKGNRNYISINTHSGKAISRRDDIESLGYNLIYFMKGKLPWSHLNSGHDIMQAKMDITMDKLCEGLPEEFKEFIEYAKKLEFTEKPDYEYLKNLLKKVAEKNGIDVDKVKYDWVIKMEEKEKEKEKGEKENLKEDEKVKEEKEKADELGNEKEKEMNEKDLTNDNATKSI